MKLLHAVRCRFALHKWGQVTISDASGALVRLRLRGSCPKSS